MSEETAANALTGGRAPGLGLNLTSGLLLVLIVAALALRVAWVQREPIFPDSSTYLSISRSILNGRLSTDFREGIKTYLPPLYPLATSTFSLVTPDIETAAVAVSSLAGALLILPVFLLGRRLYGARAGWIAAALTALSPLLIHWSAHILTESLFILCYVSAAALGWRAMTEQRPHLFFFAGFVCALAYLTRVIGLTLLPVLVIWMMIVARRQRAPIRSTAVFLVAMGLGFLVLAGPYWISLYRELGQWTISGSYGSVANVLALAGSSDLAVWERTGGRGESIGLVQKMSANLSTYIGVLTATYSVGLLFAIAAAFPPARTKGGTWYLLTVIAAYVAALLLSIAVPLPGERIRYSSPLAPLIMVLAAGGIARLAHLAGRAAARVTAGAAGVLVVSLAIQPLYLPGLSFAPLWKDTPPSRHKIVGVWIRDHLPHPLAIMARKPYVPYYADAVWFMTPTTIDGVLELARTKHVEYLIVDRGTDPALRPELAFLLDPGRAPDTLQLVASQKIENGPVIVALYRIKTT